MKNTLPFICGTNILVRLLTINMENCLIPKNSENVRSHYSQTSRENGTPSSGTSPLVSYSGAPRALRARVGGAPYFSKSTHPRKFGNHVTVNQPPTADRPSAPQENQCLLSHFQLVWEPKRKLVAHQCCDQLTAIKTGYPLISIT